MLSPNQVTFLSLPLSVLSAYFLSRGDFFPAGLLLLLIGGCDLLDGFLARKKGLVTSYGAFLDSTVDRIAEFFLFMGIFLFYFRQGSLLMAGAAYWAMGGSFVISYTRARAENFIESARVGFWERPERMASLLLGMLSGNLGTVLWVLAFGTTLTALHRIVHVRRVLQNLPPPSTLERFLFWDHPRKSWPYHLYVLLVILLTLVINPAPFR